AASVRASYRPSAQSAAARAWSFGRPFAQPTIAAIGTPMALPVGMP
ncbi:MAG: hypothetical protein RLZZ528_2997, partial [Pseudomonadota bacterium]